MPKKKVKKKKKNHIQLNKEKKKKIRRAKPVSCLEKLRERE